MCGKFLGDERAIHHIIFGGDARGMGGRRIHNLEEMITLCWMWGGNCHDRAHREKKKWQEILLYCATRRGVTAFQVARWQSAAQHKTRRNK